MAGSWVQRASHWLRHNAARKPTKNFVQASACVLGLVIGVVAVESYSPSFPAYHPLFVSLLFDILIPLLSGIGFVLCCLLAARTLVHVLADAQSGRAFGRKGHLAVCGAAVLFALSCFYRALNIADEGAAMCRGKATPFNAPVAGRFVATIGEVALVVQISVYIDFTAARLGVTRGLWASVFSRFTSLPFTTLVPVLIAEGCSWTGVLSGNSKFYCVEYVLWMFIGFTWAWDSAEMLHKSVTWRDRSTHFALLLAAISLCLFNLLHEIPHFFKYHRAGTPTESVAGVWECIQAEDSPLWVKRLPFFVCYFVGCSWSSMALAYRFQKHVMAKGGLERNRQKQN
eukprot:c15414_g1_i1.p1 GENE.c15414_g1_i1~~c15414_g1_i1.p1  ORF type:complete len:359 (+),score=69.40 c15414_g1_i1:54-1079(+)